jgi:hypothetical protein
VTEISDFIFPRYIYEVYIYVHVYIHEIRVYIYIQYIYMYHAHRNCEKLTTQNLKEKEKIRILNIKKKGYVY